MSEMKRNVTKQMDYYHHIAETNDCYGIMNILFVSDDCFMNILLPSNALSVNENKEFLYGDINILLCCRTVGDFFFVCMWGRWGRAEGGRVFKCFFGWLVGSLVGWLVGCLWLVFRLFLCVFSFYIDMTI